MGVGWPRSMMKRFAFMPAATQQAVGECVQNSNIESYLGS
jgi:hypothetical protein